CSSDLVYCLIIANQIKQLAKNNLEGEAEDEAEEIMNKKMYDFSFSNNTGATLSVLAVSLSVIENNLLLILIAVVAAAVSYFMMAYMMRLMKLHLQSAIYLTWGIRIMRKS